MKAEHLSSGVQNVVSAPAASAGNGLEAQFQTPEQTYQIRNSGLAAACNLTSAPGDCDTLPESENHCFEKTKLLNSL